MIFTLGFTLILLCFGAGMLKTVRDLCERDATARHALGVVFMTGLLLMVCSAGVAIVLGAWEHLP